MLSRNTDARHNHAFLQHVHFTPRYDFDIDLNLILALVMPVPLISLSMYTYRLTQTPLQILNCLYLRCTSHYRLTLYYHLTSTYPIEFTQQREA